jgi:hypothetical protein
MLDFNIVINEIDTLVNDHVHGLEATIFKYEKVAKLTKQYWEEFKKAHPGESLDSSDVGIYLDTHKDFEGFEGTPDELLYFIGGQLGVPWKTAAPR